VVHAAEREELRAVLDRRDVADRLAAMAHGRLLGTEVAIGVDLHLEAAVAEDALGDDRHEVDALVPRGDDEGRRLVVGVGGAGADAGDEDGRVVEQRAVPAARLQRLPLDRLGAGALQQVDGVGARQAAVDIAVAVAGAELAGADLAEHRAGLAAHLVGRHAFGRA
jgi:hypothetical protein